MLARERGIFTRPRLNPVQYQALGLWMQLDTEAKSQERVQDIKMALVANDPDRWLPSIFDIPLEQMVGPSSTVSDLSDVVDEEGNLPTDAFDGQVVKYDRIPTPEEVQDKLQALLEDPTITIDGGAFWKNED